MAGRVVAIDLLEMASLPGVEFTRLDFLDSDAPEKLKKMLGGPADVVLSDMAANATGHRATDHIKIMALVETASEFAREVLKPGGAFLAKVLQGGTEKVLLADLKRNFTTVKHVKPAASRADSQSLCAGDGVSGAYVAQGFTPNSRRLSRVDCWFGLISSAFLKSAMAPAWSPLSRLAMPRLFQE